MGCFSGWGLVAMAVAWGKPATRFVTERRWDADRGLWAAAQSFYEWRGEWVLLESRWAR